MEAALGALAWRPVDFWSATPCELAAALAGRGAPLAGVSTGAEGVLREELDALRARFPDR